MRGSSGVLALAMVLSGAGALSRRGPAPGQEVLSKDHELMLTDVLEHRRKPSCACRRRPGRSPGRHAP